MEKTLYIAAQRADVKKWDESGRKLTKIRNDLQMLHARVKALDASADTLPYQQELIDLNTQISEVSVSHQVNFSGWYAHFKLFGEAEVKWIERELDLKFLKDKVPMSFWLTMFILGILAILLALMSWPCVWNSIKDQ